MSQKSTKRKRLSFLGKNIDITAYILGKLQKTTTINKQDTHFSFQEMPNIKTNSVL